MMNSTLIIFSLTLIGVTVTYGLYNSTDQVIELDPFNFKSEVIDSSYLWLVKFYVPWCNYCKSLSLQWKRVAEALQGFVKVGVLDADEHKYLSHQYKIFGYPTVKIFAMNKSSPIDYEGERTADAIAETAFIHLNMMIKQRMHK